MGLKTRFVHPHIFIFGYEYVILPLTEKKNMQAVKIGNLLNEIFKYYIKLYPFQWINYVLISNVVAKAVIKDNILMFPQIFKNIF